MRLLLAAFICAWGGVPCALAVPRNYDYFEVGIGAEVIVWPECDEPKLAAAKGTRKRMDLISPYTLEGMMKKESVQLIDVRADYDFDLMHLGGAQNIPASQIPLAALPLDVPVVLYCGKCCCPEVSAAAAALLRQGHKDISVLRGGLQEIGKLVLWRHADVATPKQLVSVACGRAKTAIESLQEKIEVELVPPVQFELNKAVLRAYSKKTLDMVAKLMALHKNVKLTIRGHTCEIGTPMRNLSLSQDRAAAVERYLMDKGIQYDRLSSQGLGDTQPIASNLTEEGRSLNRRVEFQWLEADAPDN